MGFLEETIRPAPTKSSPIWQDLLQLALLMVLAVPLLANWAGSIADRAEAYQQAADEYDRASELAENIRALPSEETRSRLGQLEGALVDTRAELVSVVDYRLSYAFSPLLLAAGGFALALRRGAIDLSIWATMSISGLITASCVQAGLSLTVAMALGAATGLGVGLINALGTTRLRVPSPMMSLATGAGLLWAGQMAFSAPIDLPGRTIEGWIGFFDGSLTLRHIRMILVGGVYVVLLLSLTYSRPEGMSNARVEQVGLFVSLMISGVLAGLAGAFSLLETARAYPVRMVGDLRVPAAAILSGAVFLTGKGRSMLTIFLLPLSLLLVVQWRQEVYDIQVGGYMLHVAALIVIVMTAHSAVRTALDHEGYPKLAIFAAMLAVGGMFLIAFSAMAGTYVLRNAKSAVGVLFCGLGLLFLIVTKLLIYRRKKRLRRNV